MRRDGHERSELRRAGAGDVSWRARRKSPFNEGFVGRPNVRRYARVTWSSVGSATDERLVGPSATRRAA
jgi:hypothetical protein